MIRHIVLFKFRTDIPGTEKRERLACIQTALEALPHSVEPLKRMEVGINCNPDEEFDLAITSEFESMEGLQSYVVHPEHLKVGKIIRNILEKRACVDYEF